MPRPKKGSNETLVKETNEDLKPLLVNFKGENTKYEFTNAIICGLLSNAQTDEISTIISGFDKYDDFVMVFNNVILQAYDFLKINAENSPQQVIEAIRYTVNQVLDGIADGEFDEYFNSSINLEEK